MNSLKMPVASTTRTVVGSSPLALCPRHPRRTGQRGATLTPLQATTIQRTAAPASLGQESRDGWAVMEPHGKLKPWTHTVGPLGELEVDIHVTCNGLCMSDISMRDNHWGISKYNFIPGHEVVGVVKAVGAGVKSLKVGQRAGVGWIKDSCRSCPACLRGNENVCVTGYTGTIVMGGHGGFQDTIRAPADFAYAIPDGLDSISASPLLCAGVTVYAPLRRHIQHPGSSVAVLGVGGLGHLGLQFAAAMGSKVTAIDVDATKEKETKSLGATRFVTFADATGDGPKSIKNEFDVILNCAAAKIDTGKLMEMLKPDGTLIQIGIPGGDTMQVPLQSLVFGQKKIAGSIVGGRADMKEMLETAAIKGVRPMVETFPLSLVNEAMEYMLSGKARYRVVLLSEGYTPEPDASGLQRLVAKH